MKKKTLAAFLSLAVFAAAGCNQSLAQAQIKVPLYDSSANASYQTAEVQLRDLSQTASVGGKVDYVFADTLSVPEDSNLISYNVKKGDKLAKGDVIAVFDSSAYSYDFQNQKILTDSAYSRYISSGSEASRLEYEQEERKLALIQYKIDEFTIKAPYDCVVTRAERMETGSVIAAGTSVCAVADPDDVYVYVTDNTSSFCTGMPVGLKFGTDATYSAHVVMTPSERSRDPFTSSVIIKFDDGEYEKAKDAIGNIAAAGWATVIVKTFERHNALTVPSAAVMQYSGSTYCYLDENGERARVPVEVGDTIGEYTIILSGLCDGDTVSYLSNAG